MSEEITPETIGGFDPRAAGERIAELVAQETEDEEEEAEGESEPAEPEEETDPQQVAIMQALGEYLSVVQANLPEDVTVKPCHFCHGFGFNPIAALQAPGIDRCAVCGGIGVVATGSLVNGNETCMCSNCKGTGFKAETGTGLEIVQPDGAPAVRMLSEAEIQEIAAQAQARAGVNAA